MTVALICAVATPTVAEANPLAVMAVGHVLKKLFGHHSTPQTGTVQAQAQGLASPGDNVVSSKVEKMELERIRQEIHRDRVARKWKPLKQVRFLPPGSSNL